MKRTMWKRALCLSVTIMMVLCVGFGSVSVLGAAQDDATNLITGDDWLGESSDLATMGGKWNYSDGKLSTNQRDQATKLLFDLPDLTDSFVWSGDVKIKTDFKDLSSATPGSGDWVRSKMQGLRFLIQDVNGTKNGTIALSSDWKPYTEGFASNVDVLSSTAIKTDAQMNANESFAFRIVKVGSEITCTIDGVSVIEQTLDTGDYTVIGLISWYGDFEITNLSVMNLDINQHPTQTPIVSQTDHAGYGGSWSYANDIYTTNKVTQATELTMNLPDLQESFVWTGKVQVKNDFVDYSNAAAGSAEWVRSKMQGFRWTIKKEGGSQVTLALSGDWKPYTEGFTANIDVLASASINSEDPLMNTNDSFTFKIIKVGNQMTFAVNGKLLFDGTFDSGDTPILGMLAFYGDFDVSDVAVRNVGVAPTTEDNRVEGPNLIQGTGWLGAQTDHATMEGAWSYANGILTTNKLDQATEVMFNLPDLSNDFVWSGDVKIKTDFKDCSSATPGSTEWVRGKMQGLRFVIKGSNQASARFALSSDWKPYTEGFASNIDVLSSTPIKSDDAQMNAGDTFSFKIIKKGNEITVSIDDNIVLEKKLDTGDATTIGLFSFYSDVEITNLKVSNYVDPSTIVPAPPTGDGQGNRNPGTGDSGLNMAAMLVVLSLCGIVLCGTLRRRETDR